MIRKIIFAVIVVAIGATAAYQLGWLSGGGEDAYEEATDAVLEQGESIVDKAKDAVN